jgi:hypothetical protein
MLQCYSKKQRAKLIDEIIDNQFVGNSDTPSKALKELERKIK